MLDGLKLKKMIGSEELMLRDMYLDLYPIMVIIIKKNKDGLIKKVPCPCHVCSSMTILVPLRNTMKQKGCFIDISVVLVLHRRARSVLIVSMIVKNLKKKRETLGMVKKAHLQPDHVQENLCNTSKNNASSVNSIVNVGK